jgi:hypothetical protein
MIGSVRLAKAKPWIRHWFSWSMRPWDSVRRFRREGAGGRLCSSVWRRACRAPVRRRLWSERMAASPEGGRCGRGRRRAGRRSRSRSGSGLVQSAAIGFIWHWPPRAGRGRARVGSGARARRTRGANTGSGLFAISRRLPAEQAISRATPPAEQVRSLTQSRLQSFRLGACAMHPGRSRSGSRCRFGAP